MRRWLLMILWLLDVFNTSCWAVPRTRIEMIPYYLHWYLEAFEKPPQFPAVPIKALIGFISLWRVTIKGLEDDRPLFQQPHRQFMTILSSSVTNEINYIYNHSGNHGLIIWTLFWIRLKRLQFHPIRNNWTESINDHGYSKISRLLDDGTVWEDI